VAVVGRFARNEIISLLEVNRRLNLAESTSYDLTLGDLLAMIDVDELRALRLGYGSAAGLSDLRELAAEVCGVAPDSVLTTAGTALGLFLLAFELCGGGGEAVLQTPCFPPSRDALVACGATVIESPCRFDDGYRLDLDQYVAALTPRTCLVSVASPQNPSGVTVSAESLTGLLAAMNDVCPEAYLFVDETYREAVYGVAATPPSAASLDPRVIVGTSVSKAHGAPGLRVGWLTVQDADLYERLKVAKLNTVISGSVVDETLAAAVLRHRNQLLTTRRDLLARGLREVETWHARELHRVDWVRPDGGALCCMRLRGDVFSAKAIESFWKALPDLELQLAPGNWFGEGAEVFRLGFGYLPQGVLVEALCALSNAMDQALVHAGSRSAGPERR
jgi:aspartate/methionine/tyrosine aminotransferase